MALQDTTRNWHWIDRGLLTLISERTPPFFAEAGLPAAWATHRPHLLSAALPFLVWGDWSGEDSIRHAYAIAPPNLLVTDIAWALRQLTHPPTNPAPRFAVFLEQVATLLGEAAAKYLDRWLGLYFEDRRANSALRGVSYTVRLLQSQPDAAVCLDIQGSLRDELRHLADAIHPPGYWASLDTRIAEAQQQPVTPFEVWLTSRREGTRVLELRLHPLREIRRVIDRYFGVEVIRRLEARAAAEPDFQRALDAIIRDSRWDLDPPGGWSLEALKQRW